MPQGLSVLELHRAAKPQESYFYCFQWIIYLFSNAFWFCFLSAAFNNHKVIGFSESWDVPNVVMVSLRSTWKAVEFFYIRATVMLFVWLCSHRSLSLSPPARPHDFFDAQTMDAIRHRAICLNLATHIESVGNGHSVVFHSTVSLCTASQLYIIMFCHPATCLHMNGFKHDE